MKWVCVLLAALIMITCSMMMGERCKKWVAGRDNLQEASEMLMKYSPAAGKK